MYGWMTHSWLNSPEHRQMKKECAKATEAYTPGPLIDVPLLCTCPQRDHPHELSVHAELMRESYNPALRHRWPWLLCAGENVGPR